MASSSFASARATQSIAPWMALEQMSLDTQLSPVLHVHKLPLGLFVDAQFIAPLIDDLKYGFNRFMGVFVDMERCTEYLLCLLVEEVAHVLGARDIERITQDDIDARGNEVAADGNRLFTHPLRRNTDHRDIG